MYKKDPASGEIASSPGEEFYDDSIPFDGVYPDFVKRIMEVSRFSIIFYVYVVLG